MTEEKKTRTRVCDSRCYDARLPACNCICGGVNHKKGFANWAQWMKEKNSSESRAAQSAEPKR